MFKNEVIKVSVEKRWMIILIIELFVIWWVVFVKLFKVGLCFKIFINFVWFKILCVVNCYKI